MPAIIIWTNEKTASRIERSTIQGVINLCLWHSGGLSYQRNCTCTVFRLWCNHKGFDLLTWRGDQVFSRIPTPLKRHSGTHPSIQAKNCLDGAKLYESICKMNIYYSNFRSVDLKHETTEGLNLDPVVFTPSYYFYYPMGTYVPMAI